MNNAHYYAINPFEGLFTNLWAVIAVFVFAIMFTITFVAFRVKDGDFAFMLFRKVRNFQSAAKFAFIVSAVFAIVMLPMLMIESIRGFFQIGLNWYGGEVDGWLPASFIAFSGVVLVAVLIGGMAFVSFFLGMAAKVVFLVIERALRMNEAAIRGFAKKVLEAMKRVGVAIVMVLLAIFGVIIPDLVCRAWQSYRRMAEAEKRIAKFRS